MCAFRQALLSAVLPVSAIPLWSADAPVRFERLSLVCGALAGASFLDLASSDSLKCSCFLDRHVDIAGDAERLVEVVACFAVCPGQD
jgi:hypothetical protein